MGDLGPARAGQSPYAAPLPAGELTGATASAAATAVPTSGSATTTVTTNSTTTPTPTPTTTHKKLTGTNGSSTNGTSAAAGASTSASKPTRVMLARGAACQTCRSRKVKCDGAMPICAQCKKSAAVKNLPLDEIRCVYERGGGPQRSKKVRSPSASTTSSSLSSRTGSQQQMSSGAFQQEIHRPGVSHVARPHLPPPSSIIAPRLDTPPPPLQSRPNGVGRKGLHLNEDVDAQGGLQRRATPELSAERESPRHAMLPPHQVTDTPVQQEHAPDDDDEEDEYSDLDDPLAASYPPGRPLQHQHEPAPKRRRTLSSMQPPFPAPPTPPVKGTHRVEDLHARIEALERQVEEQQRYHQHVVAQYQGQRSPAGMAQSPRSASYGLFSHVPPPPHPLTAPPGAHATLLAPPTPERTGTNTYTSSYAIQRSWSEIPDAAAAARMVSRPSTHHGAHHGLHHHGRVNGHGHSLSTASSSSLFPAQESSVRFTEPSPRSAPLLPKEDPDEEDGKRLLAAGLARPASSNGAGELHLVGIGSAANTSGSIKEGSSPQPSTPLTTGLHFLSCAQHEDWPCTLPSPSSLRRVLHALFGTSSALLVFLDRARLMASLDRPPTSQEFPHIALLHALCALAALASPLTAEKLAQWDPRDRPYWRAGGHASPIEHHFAHARLEVCKGADDAEAPSNLMQIIQAAVITSCAAYSLSRHREMWLLSGVAIRLVLALRLDRLPMWDLESGTESTVNMPPAPFDSAARGGRLQHFREDSFTRGVALGLAGMDMDGIDGSFGPIFGLLPPARDMDEHHERAATFWAVFALDRYASSVLGLPTTIDEAKVTTPVPSLAGDSSTTARDCTQTSTLQGGAGAVYHKAVTVLGQVSDYVQALPMHHKAGKGRSDCDILRGIRESDDFRHLDTHLGGLSQAAASGPEDLLARGSTNQVDAHRLAVSVLPHAATILLHERVIDPNDRSESSSLARCFTSLKSAVDALCFVHRASLELAHADVFLPFFTLVFGRAAVRHWAITRRWGDPKAEHARSLAESLVTFWELILRERECSSTRQALEITKGYLDDPDSLLLV